jgi:hypothetical protein
MFLIVAVIPRHNAQFFQFKLHVELPYGIVNDVFSD